MVPASYLYVPGDRPERFTRALSSGAGGVILDLEDAVALAAKADARAAVVDQLQKPAAVEPRSHDSGSRYSGRAARQRSSRT